MREIDLLLLEDLMMRRNFQPTKVATALQTTCMLLLLLGAAVILAHALKYAGMGEEATSPVMAPSSEVSLMIPVP